MKKPKRNKPTTRQSDQEYLQEHEMSRRDFMLDSLALGGLAAAFGMSASTAAWGSIQPPADEVVRIGYLPITDATVLLVAHAKGFFEEEGLKTEPPTLIRGWSPLVEGFAAGRFNLVHFLKPIPIWMRYNNNFPVKIMSWAHLNGSGLVVGRHTDAKSFADLGGKQVAVPYWYSMHNIVLQMGLRHAGLTPVIKSQSETLAPNEVNLQIMPPPDMPPALAARKIDAFIVAEPFNAVGEMLAGGKMLRFTGDIWRNHPCCVVCMNENQVNANPVWTQKVMNAIVKAQIYSQQNKKEVAHLLSRDGKGYLPMAANVVEQAMTLYDQESYADPNAIQNANWGSGRIDFQPWPFPSATRLIVNELKQTLVGGDTTFLQDLDPDFVVDDLVDYRFVKAAMDKHPGWKDAPGFDADNPFDREEVVKL
ncbi:MULTISPECIES: ABC transporter substrate-binding protein [Marinobacter]|jgi:NitT/TauT family transport system substrate-binding protein|uniref:ABC transporter substrate-binding protein n=1 Tax=Marinobacter shengliensis TaxID=1389223 RepID=A0ABV4W7D9_9GAMM|nr:MULTISPECIES: ABC transporter substrate-binding protein [Marinobacter]AMQ89178.1 ABC transporter substrate-binding protein [Marinobacter sp. LQ44]MCD1629343.1 ABC transporter substrate-binding protein [Marinobacter shengliensis]